MIYFFSYGDDNYRNSKIRIEQEAKNSRMFDHIKIYGREHIDIEFLSKTKPYIDMPRGGGYWLWKPFLIKKTFDMMNEGDYCVYADAGCTINPNGKDRLHYYFQLMDKEDTGIFRFFFRGTKELTSTSHKVFEFFGVDKDINFMSSDHLMATVMIFKKCKNSIEFVDKYYDIAISNPDLFSDKYDDYVVNNEFKNHRHDQSISSCLVKLGKFTTISDETYSPDDGATPIPEGFRYLYLVRKVPFLATRIRN